MIALTRKTDYALVAMVHLARQRDDLCSAREIASAYGVPAPALMNIMKSLTRAGLIESVRGVHGGYRLTKSPEKVSLKNVIAAIEGPMRLLACTGEASRKHGLERSGCDLARCCPARKPAEKVHKRFDEFLDGVTVAELAGDTCPSIVPSANAIVEISV